MKRLTDTSNEILEAIRSYSENDCSILPVHGIQDGKCTCGKNNCSSPGKHPVTRHGVKDATSDLKVNERRWGNGGTLNIALATGRKSGVLVLDVDDQHGGSVALDALENKLGSLPETHVVETGRGRHLYFRHPQNVVIKNSAGKLGAGLDIRSDGGFVVCAPSRHANGRDYVPQDHFGDVGDFKDRMTELPERWLAEIQGPASSHGPSKRSNKNGSAGHDGPILESKRNITLTSKAGAMRRLGFTQGEIKAALLFVNKEKCQPPLDESEVKKIAESVSRYEPERDVSESEMAGPYEATATGIIHHKQKGDTISSAHLTNFIAKIAAEVEKDDGAEISRCFEVEAKLNKKPFRFNVTASEFSAMAWAVREMGAQALLYPGFTNKDHARCAIQMLSKEIQRMEPGDTRLKDYNFPEPPDSEELLKAIRSVLFLLKLAPPQITYPLIAAAFRSVLGEASQVDFSLFFVGPTGCQKTELTALIVAFFGAGFHGKNLPGNWSTTANSLEKQAFLAKDVVFVIDDFAPTGTTSDIARMHREADRVLRAQGNRSGRGRMRADGSLRSEKYPRCLVVSSGEDIPRGQSLRARTLILEVSPGMVDLSKLTEAQKMASSGKFVKVMAGFIKHIAPRMDDLKKSLPARRIELRDSARKSPFVHDRTPDLVASLMLGLEMFAKFALESEAITEDEHDELITEGWRYLGEAAKAQMAHQTGEDPATRFLELVGSAISSGAAHIASTIDLNQPDNPARWGYREFTIGTGSNERYEWRPQGAQIGWVDNNGIYLEPDSSYALAQKISRDQGTGIPVTQKILWKRIHEKRLLVTVEKGRNTFKKDIHGQRRRVLHLNTDVLSHISGAIGASGAKHDKSHKNNELCPDSAPRLFETTEKPGRKNGAQAQSLQSSAPDAPIAPVLEDNTPKTSVEGEL